MASIAFGPEILMTAIADRPPPEASANIVSPWRLAGAPLARTGGSLFARPIFRLQHQAWNTPTALHMVNQDLIDV